MSDQALCLHRKGWETDDPSAWSTGALVRICQRPFGHLGPHRSSSRDGVAIEWNETMVVRASKPMPVCDGRCVSASDVGMPEYEPHLVTIDPHCSLHGFMRFPLAASR